MLKIKAKDIDKKQLLQKIKEMGSEEDPYDFMAALNKMSEEKRHKVFEWLLNK